MEGHVQEYLTNYCRTEYEVNVDLQKHKELEKYAPLLNECYPDEDSHEREEILPPDLDGIVDPEASDEVLRPQLPTAEKTL